MTKLPTEFADLGDIQLAYCQHGSGPHLLLIHGNSESKTIFSKYQTNFFAAMHSWALDSRCHGESRSKDENLTIEQISKDILRFCRAKGITTASVIGYSDGGNIALFLAKKAPQLFPKVIAVSPNTLVSGTTDDSLRLIRNVMSVLKFLEKIGCNVKKRIMVIDLMLRDIGLSFADLKTIRTSVKILYAEKDMIKEEHIQEIAAAIPGCTLDKVMGVTHMSIIHDPLAIGIMQDFLFQES
jgi:pimeloyl-ACP methyl ester carboxylesterase